MDELLKEILQNVRTGPGQYETAAVLTRTADEAEELYSWLKNTEKKGNTLIHWIHRDSTAFRNGITVSTWYLSKGLEFDQVFFVSFSQSAPMGRQASYISATRALHELYMFSVAEE